MARHCAYALAVAASGMAFDLPSVKAANDAYSPDATSGLFSTSFTLNTTTPTAGGTSSPASGDALYFGAVTTGTTTLTDDLAAGTTFAGFNFLAGASAFTIGGNAFTLSGAITNNSASLETINNAITLAATEAINANAGSITLGGIISGTGFGLTKNGTGTLTLSGADTYTGATTINGGTLNLTGSLASTALAFTNSGTLNYAPAAAATKTFSTTSFSGGNAVLNVTAGSTLALGAYTRSAGATLQLGTTGTTTTSTTTLSNSIVGPWATIGTGASTRFATLTSGAFSGFTGTTSTWTAATSATTNYEITDTTATTFGGSTRNANTVRYAGSAPVIITLGNSANGAGLLSNGVMNVSSSLLTFNTAGSGTAGFFIGSTNELVLNAANAGITVTAPIHNTGTAGGTYGTTASAVTVQGANTVTLGGANTFTGNLYVDSGTLNAGLGLGDPGTTAFVGSALGNIGTTYTRTVSVNNGATLALTAGNTLGAGGSTNTLAGLTLAINPGGVFQTGSATSTGGFWNKIGAINLNNGTIHIGTGANNTTFETLALIGTVTVSGSAPSVIDNLAGSTAGSNGIHLGQNATAGQAITFNVADVTGDSNVDLTVAPALLNTSATLTASGLTKAGTGTMLLTGVSTYTGPTTVSAGTLQLGNGTTGNDGSIGGTSGVSIASGAALAFNRFGSVSSSYPISGAGNVTMSGAGTQTLTGANTYTGTTSINSGTLTFGGAQSTGLGSFAVNSGGTLGLQAISAGTTVASTGGLTFGTTTSSTSGLLFNFNNLGNPTTALGSFTGALTKNGTINVTLANFSALTSGTNIPLLSYGSEGGTGTFNLATTSAGHTTYSLTDTSTGLFLNAAVLASNKWTGAVNNTWDINTTLNWNAPDQKYLDGDNVVFDDTASRFAVNIAQTVTPSAVTFSNSANNYTLSGAAIAGTGPLTLNGTGTVVLTNANTYTGTTTIGAGATLQLGDGTTDGSINTSGSIVDNGTLVYNRSTGSSFTYSNVISGSGAVVKNGAGTQVLSGANTYTGGTTINAGVLSVGADNNLGAVGTGASGVLLNGGTLTTTAGFADTHAITVGAAGGTINVTTNGQLFMNTANTLLGSGPLSLVGGNGTLTANVGNLRVAQTNTYNGAVTVSTGGIFEYGVAGAVDAAATFTVGNQGELALQGTTAITLPNAVTISGGTNSVLSFENGNLGVYGGNIVANAGLTVGLRDWYNYATIRSGTISGVISGAGGLTTTPGTATTGNPVLTLTAIDTYTGATNIAANTTLQLGNGTVDGTISASSGIADNGTLIYNRSTGSSFTYGGGISGTGALTKTGAGTQILTGTNSYTGVTTVSGGTLAFNGANSGAGTNVTLSGGTAAAPVGLTLGNTAALGTASLINVSGGTTVATVTYATDGGDTAYQYNASSGATLNVVLDRATPGTTVTHNLSTPLTATAGGPGSATLNFTLGANVSGTATASFDQFNLGGGSGGTTLLAPAAGTVVSIGTVTKGLNNTAQTLGLGGVTTGNQITGVISNGSATVGTSAIISLAKSNTSTWTLGGANTYTGTTAVSGGTLLIASTGSINASPTVSVTAGALTLQTAAGLNDAGTLSLASGTTLNLDEANAGGTSSETINYLIINGTSEPAGTYTAAQLTALEKSGDNVVFESMFGETLTVTAVPEPSTVLGGILLTGVFGWVLRRRARAASAA